MELLENKAKETRQVQTYTSITFKKKKNKRKVGTTKNILGVVCDSTTFSMVTRSLQLESEVSF